MTQSESWDLSALLENTSVGLAVCDAQGLLSVLSPALEDLLGQPFAPWAEADWPEQFDLWSDDDTRRLEPGEAPLAMARAGAVVRDAVIATRSGGRTVFLRCNAAPLRDADGRVLGAIGLFQDVTTERRVLLQQGELRRRLMDTINHEFRTPLTTLLGHVELLQDLSPGASDDILRSLTAVATAGGRLQVLVQTVSELVDLEVDAHAARAPSDLNELVRQVADELRPIALERDLTIDVDGRDVAPAMIDAAKVRRAVAALVDNALAHAPAGSTVAIHTCGDDTWAQLSVSDVGPGIRAADRERLVHPFERGDTLEPWSSSRGLGLAVAATVATAHGGRLLLGANRPRGLVATLLLARHASVPATASDDPPHEAGEPCPRPPLDAEPRPADDAGPG